MTGQPWITACVCLWAAWALLGLLAAPVWRLERQER